MGTSWFVHMAAHSTGVLPRELVSITAAGAALARAKAAMGWPCAAQR